MALVIKQNVVDQDDGSYQVTMCIEKGIEY